jgi:hypothetical protein
MRDQKAALRLRSGQACLLRFRSRMLHEDPPLLEKPVGLPHPIDGDQFSLSGGGSRTAPTDWLKSQHARAQRLTQYLVPPTLQELFANSPCGL